MKKFILAAFLPLLYFLCASFSLPLAASADADEPLPTAGSYACILSDDVFFYPDDSGKKGLFLLPESYYVKILDSTGEYTKIEYLYDDSFVQKLVGFVRTDELTVVDYVPKRPYLYRLFEISYRLDDEPTGENGFLNEIKMTCAYYGDYRIGSETYCYVLRGEEFGYVPKPTGFSYEENTEYAEWLASQEQPVVAPVTSADEQGSSPAQIAILIALCLLVPVLAALILRPNRKNPYEDE